MLLVVCTGATAGERVRARVRLGVGVRMGVLLGVLLGIMLLLLLLLLGIGRAGVTLILVLVRMVVIIGLAGRWARGLHALGDSVDPVRDAGLSGHIALVGLRGVVVLSHGWVD